MEKLSLHPKPDLPHVISLLSHTDLEPSPYVDRLFGNLVALAMAETLDSSEQDCATARKIAAIGECRMETHWAKRITQDSKELSNFTYVENYMDLAAHEYGELIEHGAVGDRWAFVGSGPLPLSHIFFERLHGRGTFTYIDSDNDALCHGAEVAQALNGDKLDRVFTCAQAKDIDYSDFDVVIVAALVGEDNPTKVSLLKTIAKSASSHTIIAARSVPTAGRTLLYPQLQSVPNELDVLGVTCPPPDVINNLVIMRLADAC
ncbi:MAG TPA: nicotianamine synthase family protein [Candidatus Nitrosotenuis sp.]|nr:nicotianamine synthase family protein [Candidatus Nitrosotenuis sp.]